MSLTHVCPTHDLSLSAPPSIRLAQPRARRHAVRLLVATVMGVLLATLMGPALPAPASASAVGDRAVAIARDRAGSPYEYGAEGPSRFDCSGLTYWVYARLGKRLPRVSSDQHRATTRVLARNAVPGDLIFFHERGRVYHVGIYAGNRSIWHAPRTGGVVRLERIWTTDVYVGRVR